MIRTSGATGHRRAREGPTPDYHPAGVGSAGWARGDRATHRSATGGDDRTVRKAWGWNRGARGAVAAIAVLVAFGAGVAAPPPAPPVVLFDEGHGQQFHVKGTGPLDLSHLAMLVTDRGGIVKVTKSAFEPSLFRGVTALVVSGAFQYLTEAEITSIVGWLEKGGNLRDDPRRTAPV